MNREPPSESSAEYRTASRPIYSRRWLNFYQGLISAGLAIFWVTLVYGLPLRSLREARGLLRVELTHLLQANKPDTVAILDAFDRATEQILFSAAGPYFILAVATVFLVAHLVAVKRRLNAAERDIRMLRDVVSGVDGISFK